MWLLLVVTFLSMEQADGDDVLVMPGSPVSSMFFEFNPPAVAPSAAVASPDVTPPDVTPPGPTAPG